MRVIRLILSRLIRATISVFFVPCCPVLLSFYLVLSYMFKLNKWRKLAALIRLNIVKSTLVSTCPVFCGPSACKSLKLSLVCTCLVNEIVCLPCHAVQLPPRRRSYAVTPSYRIKCKKNNHVAFSKHGNIYYI